MKRNKKPVVIISGRGKISKETMAALLEVATVIVKQDKFLKLKKASDKAAGL